LNQGCRENQLIVGNLFTLSNIFLLDSLLLSFSVPFRLACGDNTQNRLPGPNEPKPQFIAEESGALLRSEEFSQFVFASFLTCAMVYTRFFAKICAGNHSERLHLIGFLTSTTAGY
jgi:hypothetical protein